jgi:hypothetical protein
MKILWRFFYVCFENSSIILRVGVILTVIYIIIGIFEVNNFTQIKSLDKVLWTIGFVLFSLLGWIILLDKKGKYCLKRTPEKCSLNVDLR